MRLTNISNRLTSCSAHSPVLIWVPIGDLPRSDGYVRLSSSRYHDWQLLAYEGSRDKEVFRREGELYAQWLASQPSAVERPEYATPTRLLRRSGDDIPPQREYVNSTVHLERREDEWSRQGQFPTEDVASDDESDQQPVLTTVDPPDQDDVEPGVNEEPGPTMNSACLPEGRSEHSVGPNDPSEDDPGPGGENRVESELKSRADESSVEILERLYVSVATVLSAEANSEHPEEYSTAEHTANTINLEYYAHELAFLPDLTEALTTELDYSATNVRHPELSLDLQEKVVRVLKEHEKIMISSGNALPPPAYGVVCDIDVQGHPPIKQKARRVPLRHLKKLYELLKGLLKAGLVSFSTSPWASPIVIVLKKNGVDIRLCIDYKMVNAVTAIMEYAMPLVDDLLTDLEKYLWYCLLDAASGFWAIMMTRRARQVSAFVCALGHFEWLRMPFGLKNAPMIYQRMIDNALWGFVQPKGGWKHYAALMQSAEGQDRALREKSNTDADASTGVTKFDADLRASHAEGSVAELVNSPLADMFTNGEADASTLTPVFERRSFVDDICFGGESFEDCLGTLDRLLARFEECRISISFTKSIFVQSKVDFLSHEVTRAGIRADPKKLKAITELSFPRYKKGMQSFLGALNYYSRFIQDFAVYGAALYQVKDEDFAAGGDLSAARRSFATLQWKVADGPILRHFSRDLPVHVTLFANQWAVSTTLMQEHDGLMHPVRFCGRVLKDAEMNYHPAEKEVLALLQLLKVCYTQLAGRTIHVYTRFSTLEWVHKSKSLFGRATQFAVLLSPWHLVVQRVKEKDCAFAQLLQSTITSFVDLEDSLSLVTPPTRGSPSVRMDPQLLYARLPRDYVGYVISFDGSAKTEKHGGYGSCAWILWRLPEWTVVIAASAYLETTTVNMAEYTAMNNGVAAALDHGAEDLVIVGDSRLAIQQSLGVIACRKESLIAQLNRHKELTAKLRSVKYLHAIREFNAAADSLAGETLKSKMSAVVESEDRKRELKVLNRIREVIYEPSADTSEEVVTRSINSIRVLETRDESRSKNFFDFAWETGQVAAVTRHQARARQKHVRFATEPVIINQDTEVQDRPDNQVEETPDPQDPPGPDATNIHEPSADDIDPLIVQGERRGRISKAQDEELRWSNLKAVLKGEEAQLGYRAAREAWKMADKFVLSEDGLLYFLGANRRWGRERTEETTLRLVVPTTMIQEILQNCHDSLEGGHQGIVRTYHRVKADYYWIGLFADVEKHVRSCPDCSSSKSRPHLRGYSPGNILAERPFQMVSMDFVIPLPKTRRGNTALLLFQCAFTGFVMGKAMTNTSALRVAQAFEECVYRRFGAPSLIRHDRDPRFMSEVFQAFAEMMQSRSRATLSYRPQANGQQERSVKTVIQSVRVYTEDPLQQDWDEIVEKLIFAINNSQDSTRMDTPFYLVHGWDARSTLRAMSSSLKRGVGRQ
ncbi:hypothetical protein PR002_g19978 [Phytophthora rubi]|uniref:Integrase catalytic domain-containing protein n=1 Tax=Phytophthora rubi TaxID=129364 RepID=A0A6A3JIA4_9STRA|nr:hypothetical protein PR002_g19978 [Phytophthora rubi]